MEYPTEEQLAAIRDYKGEPNGIIPLIREAYNHHYGHMTVQNGRGIVRGRTRRLTSVTGGWSGNEDVIYALHENTVWYMVCWRSSERGGRHVYEWSSPWE